MAFNIYGWTDFIKKANSDLTPSTTGITINVSLKESCSIYKPVFILRSTADFNYFQWGNRYYNVIDHVITSTTDSEYYCEIDLYATYRYTLSQGSYLMKRQTVTLSNETFENKFRISALQDSYINFEQNEKIVTSTFDVLNRLSASSEYCYVIQFTGIGKTLFGEPWTNRFFTMCVSPTTLSSIIDTLYFSPYSTWKNIKNSGTEVPEGFQQTYVEPASFIKSVKIYPFSYSTVKALAGGTESTAYIGWTSIPVTGVIAPQTLSVSSSETITPSQVTVTTGSFNLPIVSDLANAPYFMFNSSNMQITLQTGVWGTINVPPELVYTPSTGTTQQKCEAGYLNYQLYYKVMVDFYSGESTLLLDNKTFGAYDFGGFTNVQASLGVSVPMQQVITTHGRYSSAPNTAIATLNNMEYKSLEEQFTPSLPTSIDELKPKVNNAGFGGVISSITNFLGGLATSGTNNKVSSVTDVSTGDGIFPIARMTANVQYKTPMNTPSDYNDLVGRPVVGVRSIVPGFNQIDYTSLNIPQQKFIDYGLDYDLGIYATQTEKDAIYRIMTTGWYHEKK